MNKNILGVLIVIDVQNDFVTGPLGTKEAQSIIPNIVNKIKQYKNKNAKTFFTLDTHNIHDYHDTQEGKLLPIKHCLENTPGWCLVDEIYPYCKTKYEDTFKKDHFGLSQEDWQYYFDRFTEESDINSGIEICGLTTDICVISNALILKSLYPEIPIRVDASCCAGTTPEKHKAALEVMKSCQIEVIE